MRSYRPRTGTLRLLRRNQIPHRRIWTVVEAGVARPRWNRELSAARLTSSATGSRTPRAPIIPWAMTNSVCPQPLKKPTKQNRKLVSRQSMA